MFRRTTKAGVEADRIEKRGSNWGRTTEKEGTTEPGSRQTIRVVKPEIRESRQGLVAKEREPRVFLLRVEGRNASS